MPVRPIPWFGNTEYDLSLHSATKYLNGHSDLLAGAVMGTEDAVGRTERKLRHLGGTLDPHACFLLERGIKTLVLRVNRQNATALALARLLQQHPAVSSVNYPGLTEFDDHQNAKHFFDGFGGMLAFEPKGGLEAANAFMNRLTIPIIAPSLGGVESLVTRPATTSHSTMTASERLSFGVTDQLIRVSVGIEGEADLLKDFEQALQG